MDRRRFLLTSLAGVLAGPLAAEAQSMRKVPTVGFVALPNEPSEPRWQDGFERGLRDRGYVQGQTITIYIRTYTTRDELHQALEELVRQKVDVIFVG